MEIYLDSKNSVSKRWCTIILTTEKLWMDFQLSGNNKHRVKSTNDTCYSSYPLQTFNNDLVFVDYAESQIATITYI